MPASTPSQCKCARCQRRPTTTEDASVNPKQVPVDKNLADPQQPIIDMNNTQSKDQTDTKALEKSTDHSQHDTQRARESEDREPDVQRSAARESRSGKRCSKLTTVKKFTDEFSRSNQEAGRDLRAQTSDERFLKIAIGAAAAARTRIPNRTSGHLKVNSRIGPPDT